MAVVERFGGGAECGPRAALAAELGDQQGNARYREVRNRYPAVCLTTRYDGVSEFEGDCGAGENGHSRSAVCPRIQRRSSSLKNVNSSR